MNLHGIFYIIYKIILKIFISPLCVICNQQYCKWKLQMTPGHLSQHHCFKWLHNVLYCKCTTIIQPNFHNSNFIKKNIILIFNRFSDSDLVKHFPGAPVWTLLCLILISQEGCPITRPGPSLGMKEKGPYIILK